MVYKTTITKLGDLVGEFIEQGMLIVFNENAPAELAEMSALHTAAELPQPVAPGDEVVFGNKKYIVTAVGDEANYTLGKMGHCTFVFKGEDETELPGHIDLFGDGMPDLKEGDAFEIHLQ